MAPSTWICLPTYNERDNVVAMLDALMAELDANGIDGHVLVIDDSSPDGTGELADGYAAREPRVEVLHRAGKEGLGRAYLAGFRHALDRGAELVIEMDCDFSHDPRDVHRLVEAAGAGVGVDLVLGSRYVPGGGVRNWPWHRRLVSKGGSLYARTILGLRVRDLTGGFKCFRRHVLEALDLDRVAAQGYTFQVELTYRAVQQGFTVREIPIVFVDRVAGESKMTGSIVLEAMWRVWQLRLRGRRRRAAQGGHT